MPGLAPGDRAHVKPFAVAKDSSARGISMGALCPGIAAAPRKGGIRTRGCGTDSGTQQAGRAEVTYRGGGGRDLLPWRRAALPGGNFGAAADAMAQRILQLAAEGSPERLQEALQGLTEGEVPGGGGASPALSGGRGAASPALEGAGWSGAAHSAAFSFSWVTW